MLECRSLPILLHRGRYIRQPTPFCRATLFWLPLTVKSCSSKIKINGRCVQTVAKCCPPATNRSGSGMKAEHRIKAEHHSAAAEHRKELRTNVLADRMGRFMQTVRQRPKGRTLLIWIAILAVI